MVYSEQVVVFISLEQVSVQCMYMYVFVVNKQSVLLFTVTVI